jgi:hypothetical protein
MPWGLAFLIIVGVALFVQGGVVLGAHCAGPGSFFNLLAGIILFPALVMLDVVMPFLRPLGDLLPEKSAWTGVVVVSVMIAGNALVLAGLLVGLMRFGARPGCRR